MNWYRSRFFLAPKHQLVSVRFNSHRDINNHISEIRSLQLNSQKRSIKNIERQAQCEALVNEQIPMIMEASPVVRWRAPGPPESVMTLK